MLMQSPAALAPSLAGLHAASVSDPRLIERDRGHRGARHAPDEWARSAASASMRRHWVMDTSSWPHLVCASLPQNARSYSPITSASYPRSRGGQATS